MLGSEKALMNMGGFNWDVTATQQGLHDIVVHTRLIALHFVMKGAKTSHQKWSIGCLGNRLACIAKI
jgi:hypothetical protein